MNHEKAVRKQRLRRRLRVRGAYRGTSKRPRLSVFRSHKHIYCQLIDDGAGRTIASASTREKQFQSSGGSGGNRETAASVGRVIAERAAEVGVKDVCFDRGHYKYHGRVAALAEAAREAGLAF